MQHLQIIQSKIYEIRGQQVMLDFDLAAMYQVETRALNQAVKRNIERFPKDFMFQLTLEECHNLKSQSVISSWGGTRKLPYSFTEHGVVMLSSVLRSDIAMQTSVLIVRAFVAMRQLITAAPQVGRMEQLEQQMKELKQYMEEVLIDQNDINEDTRMQLELINQTLAELQVQKRQDEKPRRPIGFIQPKEKE
ncbi:MAG: ORF6N domain-containing protein [Prevotellaceae bacterium]|nr:ORF6N domain-containing protein [Prevotellaceae bacterium]